MRHARPPARAFGRAARARAVHENAPHHLRRDEEELRAILPHRALLIDQAEVDLVDQGGRLQQMPRAFAPQVRGGAAAQFLIDDRHEAVAGAVVTGAPGVEQRRHVMTGRGHGWGPLILSRQSWPVKVHEHAGPEISRLVKRRNPWPCQNCI